MYPLRNRLRAWHFTGCVVAWRKLNVFAKKKEKEERGSGDAASSCQADDNHGDTHTSDKSDKDDDKDNDANGGNRKVRIDSSDIDTGGNSVVVGGPENSTGGGGDTDKNSNENAGTHATGDQTSTTGNDRYDNHADGNDEHATGEPLPAQERAALIQLLTDFVDRMNGKKYGLDLLKLMQRRGSQVSTSSAASTKSEGGDDDTSENSDSSTGEGHNSGGGEHCNDDGRFKMSDTRRDREESKGNRNEKKADVVINENLPQQQDEDHYFCSELVASAYKEMGVLPKYETCSESAPSSWFYPPDFSSPKEKQFLNPQMALSKYHCYLSKEVQINFTPLSVSSSYVYHR